MLKTAVYLSIFHVLVLEFRAKTEQLQVNSMLSFIKVFHTWKCLLSPMATLLVGIFPLLKLVFRFQFSLPCCLDKNFALDSVPFRAIDLKCVFS